MEEILAFQKIAKIDLLDNLEKISSLIPNRIPKLEGSVIKENQKNWI